MSEEYPLKPIDLSEYLEKGQVDSTKRFCEQIAKQLKATGCLVVRDPRVSQETNEKFLDMMEAYFEQPLEKKQPDIHPELSYQVGATPSFVERPKDHSNVIKTLNGTNSAHKPTGADAKWRFFWRIGERPKTSEYKELNSPQVIPKAFKHWEKTMNDWGEKLIGCVKTVVEMLAIGLKLPKNAFVDLLEYGPHLLAPTGSDLNKHGKLNTILAGFHTDLNLLTIHGKSRYPALYIWLRDGTKIPVKVPDGCLLLQAGQQMEYLTGGTILAGFHEVVVVEKTMQFIEEAKKNQRSLWRVSSTLFSHCASDKILKPLAHFATKETLEKYPPITAGQQVTNELKAIKLSNK